MRIIFISSAEWERDRDRVIEICWLAGRCANARRDSVLMRVYVLNKIIIINSHRTRTWWSDWSSDCASSMVACDRWQSAQWPRWPPWWTTGSRAWRPSLWRLWWPSAHHHRWSHRGRSHRRRPREEAGGAAWTAGGRAARRPNCGCFPVLCISCGISPLVYTMLKWFSIVSLL